MINLRSLINSQTPFCRIQTNGNCSTLIKNISTNALDKTNQPTNKTKF